jgi:hypothetical protein
VNSGTREAKVVPASYKTFAMLLIHTVKLDKSLVGDKGKKKIYAKRKRSFVI